MYNFRLLKSEPIVENLPGARWEADFQDSSRRTLPPASERTSTVDRLFGNGPLTNDAFRTSQSARINDRNLSHDCRSACPEIPSTHPHKGIGGSIAKLGGDRGNSGKPGPMTLQNAVFRYPVIGPHRQFRDIADQPRTGDGRPSSALDREPIHVPTVLKPPTVLPARCRNFSNVG